MSVQLKVESRLTVLEVLEIIVGVAMVLGSGLILPLGAWLIVVTVTGLLIALFARSALKSFGATYVEIDATAVSWPGHRVLRSDVVRVNDDPRFLELVLASGERQVLDLEPLGTESRDRLRRLLDARAEES